MHVDYTELRLLRGSRNNLHQLTIWATWATLLLVGQIGVCVKVAGDWTVDWTMNWVNCSAEIAPVLEVIFKQSLNIGELTSDWLTGNICPVSKKGNHSVPSNYRPISLTASCSVQSCGVYHSLFNNGSHLTYRLTTNMVLDQGFPARRS